MSGAAETIVHADRSGLERFPPRSSPRSAVRVGPHRPEDHEEPFLSGSAMHRRRPYAAGIECRSPLREGRRRLGRHLHQVLLDPSRGQSEHDHQHYPVGRRRRHQPSAHGRRGPQMGRAGSGRTRRRRREGQYLEPLCCSCLRPLSFERHAQGLYLPGDRRGHRPNPADVRRRGAPRTRCGLRHSLHPWRGRGFPRSRAVAAFQSTH